MDNKRILIMGVGNTLLSDEGFGVRAVEYLQNHYQWPPNVRLIDGGTLGLMLMAELFECDLAIILDIAQGGEAPGTFYEIEEDQLDKKLALRESAHQTSISDTLLSCGLAGHKPEILIYAMQPYNYQIVSENITDEAQAKLPEFCAKVVEELGKKGIIGKAVNANNNFD